MEVPDSHIRRNVISAVNNTGECHFMTYDGAMNTALFIALLERPQRECPPNWSAQQQTRPAFPVRKQDKIEVTANDFAEQKQAMKRAGLAPTAESAKRGRPKGSVKTPRVASPADAPSGVSRPVDRIEKVLDVAKECGGMAELKRLIDMLAEMQGG